MEKATRRGNYESGSDYVLEYGELRFSFNEDDFAQRVEQAAVKLDFVDHGLAHEELHDLLELAVNGEIADPCSTLGEHINENWTELVGPSNRSLVHWLRRLVFRGAWLDQRVKEASSTSSSTTTPTRSATCSLSATPSRSSFHASPHGPVSLTGPSQALQDVRVRARRFELLADEPRRFRRDELREVRA